MSAADRIGLLAALLLMVGGAVTFASIYQGRASTGGVTPPPSSDRLLIVELGTSSRAGYDAPLPAPSDHVREPKSTPRSRSRPRRQQPQKTPPALRTFKVKEGDSLSDIAQEVYGSGTRWPAIAAANGLTDPFLIHPGQLLKIP